MPTDSLRTQILTELKTRMLAMSLPTYWYTPPKVERFYIDPLNDHNYPHYSILAAEEDKDITGNKGPVNLVTCDLPVTIVGAMQAVEPYSTDRTLAGERMLADVERLIKAFDRAVIGGATVQAHVEKLDMNITEIEAPLVLCGAYVMLRYRHQDGDPAIA